MAARALLSGWVLGVFLLPWLIGLEGCAHTAAPRGGAPDTIPPALVLVEPEGRSVVPGFEGRVRFEFDEVISEQEVRTSVTLYPFEARPRVDKGGRDIKVRPRAGWVEDRIYHVEIAPVIRDLFRNSIAEPISYVFSTGVPLTENVVTGTVFDRITGQALVGERVDLVRLPDTLRYGTQIDSVGEFRSATLPAGSFLIIAYEDLNGDRQADDFDRADTVAVELGATDTLSLEFQVFRHDTVGPALSSVRARDSLTLELQFDGYLDPDRVLDRADFQVISLPDSARVPIDTVLHAWEYAALQRLRIEREAEAADSAALADTTAADTIAADTVEVPLPADTLAADTLGPSPLPPETERREGLPPPPADAEPQPGEAEPGVQEEAQGDEQEPEPALPTPRIVIILQRPLMPGEYLVRARQVVNLTGLAANSEDRYEHSVDPEDEGS